jgi:tetratricopeptide (TPR) repeat protein
MDHDAVHPTEGAPSAMAKRKKGPKENRPGSGDPIPLHPRALEKEIQELGRQLEGKEFESIEEAQAFLEEMLASGEGLQPVPAAPSTPLEKAQDLVYQAFETESHRKRVQLAKKALKVSPDCADAYVLLAEETATDPGEAREFYERGVKAGERALGEEAFEEDAGYFWGILETRPYMRARQGLALSLWELGERRQAVDHYQEMLRLNPNDNQGIRYLLAIALLEEGSDQELKELLDRYEDDAGATWLYTKALWTFRAEGTTEEANGALREAMAFNAFVPEYLLGERSMPGALPHLVGFGDESEAAVYFVEALPGWLKTPGGIEWLRTNAPRRMED